LLQNPVGDVNSLPYVKPIRDQGNTPLMYKGYMELLLLASSKYKKNFKLAGQTKGAIYTAMVYDDERHNPCDYSLDTELGVFNDGYSPFDDILKEQTGVFEG
jgi:hypothetical protein